MSKCINNCGFFGNVETGNYCSKCFKEVCLKEITSSENEKDSSNYEILANEKIQINTNRCWQCNKKIGLTGFKCSCNYVFCSKHRFPDDHTCLIDYKELGKLQISKNNPTVIAEKVKKI